MLLNAGVILGDRYEVIEKIGSGGMAVVYRGKDKKLERYVTIKVLREEFVTDEDFLGRFRTEAYSAARLSHPNIVRVYDEGVEGDVNYIVMEYIHGDTLKTAIKEKAPFDTRSTLNVSIQIASALAQAHKAHIVHRDIKPQNILVSTDGVVKVTDFGIARAATASTMTTTANAAGSVHYFSPEQARGGYVDEKSDIYSLGITMFEMVTGVVPFQGHNSVSIALKHISEELPDIRLYNPNCSKTLEAIIKKATMKKADERYASIDLLLGDLIRAREEGVVQEYTQMGRMERKPKPKEDAVAAMVSATPTRRSRRAEVAAQLREHPEYMEEAPTTELPEETTYNRTETRSIAVKSVYRGRRARMEEAEAYPETEEPEIGEPAYVEAGYFEPEEEETYVEEKSVKGGFMAGIEKYQKKFQISKSDDDADYEDDYEYEEEPDPGYAYEDHGSWAGISEKFKRTSDQDVTDNKKNRKAERLVVVAAVLFSIIIIGCISIWGMRTMSQGVGGFVAEENKISMPLLVGTSLEEAQATATALGFELVEEGREDNKYYGEGMVIYQSVGEETTIVSGTKIGIKVSSGYISSEMPDLVNMTEMEAMDAIQLLIGQTPYIEYEEREGVETGTVVEQDPAVGSEINMGTPVTLVVCKGEENRKVGVPDVVGRTEEDAIADLNAVGLVVGSISEAESDTVEAGLVMAQTISSGAEVSMGSVVNLVVSLGNGEGTVGVLDPNTGEYLTGVYIDPITGEFIFMDEEEETSTSTGVSTSHTFVIAAPDGASGEVSVRMVLIDNNGPLAVMDEYIDISEFPYTVTVTGEGSGTVSCYINDALQWTENVDFSG
ncbi:protein kinase domain-containing protein [Chakrabartyella piscis]|uniref:protein kinase domain-containing protein n=1 Tax=Chakrabartyella piscis TaxID=2918914 RepID=UPI002958AC87|nr:protein kinase [Chakrabartyella piscis]